MPKIIQTTKYGPFCLWFQTEAYSLEAGTVLQRGVTVPPTPSGGQKTPKVEEWQEKHGTGSAGLGYHFLF